MLDRQQLLRSFCQQERLPESFEELARTYYFPLLDWLLTQRKQVEGRPLIVGINGCQGSGKSTLASLIARILEAEQQGKVALLSIDDIYLGRQQRLALAEHVHPLLITRGVPGTHDIELGQRVLNTLCRQHETDCTAIPRFDKASDDRLPMAQWPQVCGALDTIILEGWCVGSVPQTPMELVDPINELERHEDTDGRWRHFVNQSLYNYQPLFAGIDKLIMLKAPDFDCVFHWRRLQEQKLAEQRPGNAIMSDQEIARFIQHYQRLTQANIATLPEVADVVFSLNSQHEISSAYYSQ